MLISKLRPAHADCLKKIKKRATNLSLLRPPVSVLFAGREPSDTVQRIS